MKHLKLFYSLLVMIGLLSCSNEDFFSEAIPTEKNPSIRSYSEALDIAQRSIAILSDSETRSEESITRKIDITKSKKCVISTSTRSGNSTENDTLMYVFNFTDDSGFALVSANPEKEPLLALTESGHYDPDSLSEIDGINDFVEMSKFYLTNSVTTQNELLDKGNKNSDSIIVSKHGTQLPVVWGQIDPEGLYCPNKICGCANLAIAQICAYYQYPEKIQLTYDKGSALRLNWDLILKHTTSHKYMTSDCEATSWGHNSISFLCRELGYRTGSVYKSTFTGTHPDSIAHVVKELGFETIGLESYDLTREMTYIAQGYKIIMGGYQDAYKNGHAWVVDQYANVGITITNKNTGTKNMILSQFLHVNWGWYGKSNGYFNGTVFDANDAYSPDYPERGTENIYFNFKLQTLKIKKQ